MFCIEKLVRVTTAVFVLAVDAGSEGSSQTSPDSDAVHRIWDRPLAASHSEGSENDGVRAGSA